MLFQKKSTVSTVQHSLGAQFSTLQYNTVQSVQYSAVLKHCTVNYSTIQYSQYSTVQSWSPVLQGCRAACTAGFGPCQFYRAINFFGAVPRKCLHFTFSNPIVRCCAVQCTVQYSTTVLYCTVQYSTVHYSTVQYRTVQYSTVQ